MYILEKLNKLIDYKNRLVNNNFYVKNDKNYQIFYFMHMNKII